MVDMLQKSYETVMQAQLEPIVRLMLLRGFAVTVRRPIKQNVETEVYADYAGIAPGEYEEFATQVVFGEKNFETMGLVGVTFLDKMYLFAEDILYAGDVIIVDREDEKEKSYRILPTQVIGTTLSITTRYEALSIEL
jgi:hypothetical protein